MEKKKCEFTQRPRTGGVEEGSVEEGGWPQGQDYS